MPKVKFLADWRHFERGDTLETDKKTADTLVNGITVARYIREPAKPKPKPTAKKK